jgi:hypothetical protein
MPHAVGTHMGINMGNLSPTQTPIMFDILNTCTVLYRGGHETGWDSQFKVTEVGIENSMALVR